MSDPTTPPTVPRAGRAAHRMGPDIDWVPPRRRSRLFLIMLVLSLLGSFAVIVAKVVPSLQGSGGEGNAAAVDHSGDLRELLLPAPSGSRACSKAMGTNGQLSLEQEAALSADPVTKAQALRQYGFQRGAARCWVERDGTTVTLRLVQLRSTGDAVAYAGSNSPGAGYSELGIDDLPGGKYYVGRPQGQGDVGSAVAIAQRGDIVVLATAAAIPALPRPERIAIVAFEQYGLL